MIWLEETSKMIQFQPLFHGQGHLSVGLVAQSPIEYVNFTYSFPEINEEKPKDLEESTCKLQQITSALFRKKVEIPNWQLTCISLNFTRQQFTFKQNVPLPSNTTFLPSSQIINEYSGWKKNRFSFINHQWSTFKHSLKFPDGRKQSNNSFLHHWRRRYLRMTPHFWQYIKKH